MAFLKLAADFVMLELGISLPSHDRGLRRKS